MAQLFKKIINIITNDQKTITNTNKLPHNDIRFSNEYRKPNQIQQKQVQNVNRYENRRSRIFKQNQQQNNDSDDSLGYTQNQWDEQTINFQLQDRMLDCLQDERQANSYRQSLAHKSLPLSRKSNRFSSKIFQTNNNSNIYETNGNIKEKNDINSRNSNINDSNSNRNGNNQLSIDDIINQKHPNELLTDNNYNQQKHQNTNNFQQKNVKKHKKNRFSKYKKKLSNQQQHKSQLTTFNPQLQAKLAQLFNLRSSQINTIKQHHHNQPCQDYIDQIMNINLPSNFKKNKIINNNHQLSSQNIKNNQLTSYNNINNKSIQNQNNNKSQQTDYINRKSFNKPIPKSKQNQSLIIVQQPQQISGISIILEDQHQQPSIILPGKYKQQSPLKYKQQSPVKQIKQKQFIVTPKKQQSLVSQKDQSQSTNYAFTPPSSKNIFNVINQQTKINSQTKINQKYHTQSHNIIPKSNHIVQFLSITDQIASNNHQTISNKNKIPFHNRPSSNNISPSQQLQYTNNKKSFTYPHYQQSIQHDYTNKINQPIKSPFQINNQQQFHNSSNKQPINQPRIVLAPKGNASFTKIYSNPVIHLSSQSSPQSTQRFQSNPQHVHKFQLSPKPVQMIKLYSQSPTKQKKLIQNINYHGTRYLQAQTQNRIPIFIRKLRRLDSVYPNLYTSNKNIQKINNDFKRVVDGIGAGLSVIQLLYKKIIIQKNKNEQLLLKINEVQHLPSHQKQLKKMLNQQILDYFIMSQWEQYKIQQIEYIKPKQNYKIRRFNHVQFQTAMKSYKQSVNYFSKQPWFYFKTYDQIQVFLKIRRKLSHIINFLKAISQDLYTFWLYECNYPELYYDFVNFLKGNSYEIQKFDQIYAKLLLAQQYKDPVSLSIIGDKIFDKIQQISK